MAKFEEIKKEIKRFIQEGNPGDVAHSNATHKWLLKIKPDADEAMQIAALAHDIDRAAGERRLKEENWEQTHKTYEDFKNAHAENSAKIVGEIMEKFDFDNQTIERVKHLVSHHESGGDKDSNVIMDADSLSFFETNMPIFVNKFGPEKLNAKLKFMYNRMSGKAKELVKQMKFKEEYQEIIDKTIK